jgi:RNase adaptor protein for sRNA GlmZ degradation
MEKPGKNSGKLVVEINSFSYRKNLPDDVSGNGGGFVFDCRAINNPGLIHDLKEFTGKDPVIEEFFLHHSDMNEFIEDAFRLISRSIDEYISKNYNHLQLNFGCTGGRHRSVYAAEKIAKRIEKCYDVEIELIHRDLEAY